MTPFFAFLHHLAAFSLVAALAVEFVLIRGELNLGTARRLQRVDMVFGMSSGVVLVVGLLRVFYFEKGASYYFHSADRKSTRLNSSHTVISYAVFCLKKKKKKYRTRRHKSTTQLII